MFPAVNPKVRFPELEKEILEFWRKERIFQRSIDERDKENSFTFYDGPPFATGLPHYGHILAGVIKDVIPRYQTMRGHRVERRFGWDCHGLPIENIKEKELGISGKKQIEEYGIAKFNEECRSIVMRYAHDWRALVERTGRWVDMDNDYKTMDAPYMESVWWVFKQLWDKGLVYQGNKVVPYCYRCSTALSNFEAGSEYKDRQDPALTVKFKLKGEENTYVLAWTTTPWTLPSNLALAVDPNEEYFRISLSPGESPGSWVWCPADLDFPGKETWIASTSFFQRNGTKNGGALKSALSHSNLYDFLELELKEKIVQKEVPIIKGQELIGKTYEPLFPYFKDQPNAFQIIPGNFIDKEEGTGVVHMAPAYGEDDYNACQQAGIDMVNPVDAMGNFTNEVPDFAGQNVHEAKKNIIEALKNQGSIFGDPGSTLQHSYPHCWRCDTPLIYRAVPTWYVAVTKLKEQLLKNNAQTSWVPASMKDGRFGKWLEGARDWAVSRSRYWGAPLPIWQCDGCGKSEAFGSVEELFAKVPDRMAKLVLVRHAHSMKQELRINASTNDIDLPLTDKGREQVALLVKMLSAMDIDAVYSSPAQRAKETLMPLGKDIIEDERLGESRKGIFEGLSKDDPTYRTFMDKHFALPIDQRWENPYEGGESEADMARRVQSFLSENILGKPGRSTVIVSHSAILRHIIRAVRGMETEEFYRKRDLLTIKTGSSLTLYIDTQTGREFDLHKHIVDGLSWKCDCGGKFQRVPEVLDCWFESGSMPYAQEHYPFENKHKFEANFPANFIAEGQDQTRGWFYTLMVLSTALFNKPAFQNVIVNGIVLAEDGKKMSKKLKNYPDPAIVMEQYGADAMRWYLMASPAVSANDLRFSEKGVDEVVKSVLLPLWNAYSFFVTYANIDGWQPDGRETKPSNPLDQWILSELQVCITRMTEALDGYDLAAATKPVLDFIDGLTNWYIRRSRRRFWKSENDGDKAQAYATLYRVLTTLTKLTAPFIPFISEEIHKGLNAEGDSVHLMDWPKVDATLINNQLVRETKAVREIVSAALSLRAQHNLKIRQPLSLVKIAVGPELERALEKYEGLFREEINVKKVVYDNIVLLRNPSIIANAKILGKRLGKEMQTVIRMGKEGNYQKTNDGVIISDGNGNEWALSTGEYEVRYSSGGTNQIITDHGYVVSLETTLTPELEREGIARELVRTIQDLRKEADYGVSDRILIGLTGVNDQVEREWGAYIEKETLGTITRDILEWDKEAALPEYGDVGVKRV